MEKLLLCSAVVTAVLLPSATFSNLDTLAAKKRASRKVVQAVPQKPETRFAGKQLVFEEMIKSIQIPDSLDNTVCPEVPVLQTLGVRIKHIDCSDRDMVFFSTPITVTENFGASGTLAPRVRFWELVYSRFSIHSYVLHSPDYPEVMLETLNTHALAETQSSTARSNLVKRLANARKLLYQAEFAQLARMKQIDLNTLNPVQKRLVRLTAHISDPKKYAKLATNLRIQRGQKEFVRKGLNVANRYWPDIDQIFKDEGLPAELSRIALVESSFNLQAYSKVGAAGTYQLMPATGRQYLVLDGHIDERRDPIKSARAAAKLLRFYYKMTGAWPLAITSYNHGVVSIQRAVRSVGSRDLDHIIKHYDGRGFGFASKNFYSEYLAMLMTVREPFQHFPDLQPEPAHRFVTVRIPQAMTFRDALRKYKLGVNATLALNPDLANRIYRDNGMLPRGYFLKTRAEPVPTTTTADNTQRPSS